MLLFAIMVNPPQVRGGALRVITINVWSGLDYNGFARMGEYESAEARGSRFHSLVTQLRSLAPDVVFVQEANPVGPYSTRLASALDMVEIHQVVNAGLKIGPLGPPLNLKEGVSILARPELSLRKTGSWKLSGSPGIHTDILTLHADETIIVLPGRITVDGQPVNLLNVHLVATPRLPDDADELRARGLAHADASEAEVHEGILKWRQREERRVQEVRNLLERIRGLPPAVPLIVAGDFNADADADEMGLFREQGGFRDVMEDLPGAGPKGEVWTWDPVLNDNIAFSMNQVDARGRVRKGFDYMASLFVDRRRRIDYIFLGPGVAPAPGGARGVVLGDKVDGFQPSDHFGVMADLVVGSSTGRQ
ncbi:MAG: endonuclease/exonuclease/phosphatase family protein [bacterium]|nr:MAG: endonuclease/exonuclease/phosphatase family protein [bacterium]